MLEPDYIRNMTRRLRRIAQDMEDDVIAAIIAALLVMLDGEPPTETEVAEEVSEIVEKYQIEGSAELRRIFKDAVETNITNDAAAVSEAEKVAQEPLDTPLTSQIPQIEPQKVPADSFPDLTKETRFGPSKDVQEALSDPYTRELINHFHRQTQATWQNLTDTFAYEGTRAYVNAADAAAVQVSTGTSSREAIDGAIEKLNADGITVVENPKTGHRDHVDVAMERNVRTTVSQLAGDLTLQSCKRNGMSLVLVSAHYGARPTHAVWQGKVYSLTGDTDKYKDFYRETEYGQMLGLCGINCRHSFSPFAEGMHNPYEGKDFNDPQRYKDEQTQRAMERRIRKLRREKKALDEEYKKIKTLELKERRRRVAAALKEAVREYEEFCAVHGFRPLWERTRV